jgi:hypothetical protein
MLIAKYVAINLPVGTVAAFPGINLKGLLSGRKPASLTQIQTETLPSSLLLFFQKSSAVFLTFLFGIADPD